jgi:hypothetical protein
MYDPAITIQPYEGSYFDVQQRIYYDAVGWTPNAVEYYRDEGRAPCYAIIYQNMTIDCVEGNSVYAFNPLKITITETHVGSRRNNTEVFRFWP